MPIYLDNAASTPLAPEVLEAMMPYFTDFQGNPSATHASGRVLRAAVEKARKTIAQLLGAHPAEIFFTSGGTEADNALIRGAVERYGLKHIISTQIEHHAVLHVIEALEKEGKIRAVWLKPDPKGNVVLADLEAALQQHPQALVSLMHANNEIGTMIDLRAVGELCKQYGAYFHSDTVQSMGHCRFDLHHLPVHFVTASAHKFHGPKGVGFMYVQQDTPIKPFIEGGSQERNMRAGTENVAAIVGMAKALELAYQDLDAHEAHLNHLKQSLKNDLSAFGELVVFHGETDAENSLCTVLNVGFDGGGEDKMLLFQLDIAGICVSGGSACTSGSLIGSHVLAGIGANPRFAQNAVRFSFSRYTTSAELEKAVEALKGLFLKG